jgi:hypothetical protein
MDVCEPYLPEGGKMEESQIRRKYDAATGSYEKYDACSCACSRFPHLAASVLLSCIYTDLKCTVAEQCQRVNTTGCFRASFGADKAGYISMTVGTQANTTSTRRRLTWLQQ